MTPDLDRALRELATVIDFPPTPDLATAVERRLAQPRAARAWWPRWRTAVLVAALVLALAAVAGAAATRIWEDVPGFAIQRVDLQPPVPPGAGLALGPQVTAEQAAARLGAPMPLPADARLGTPDAMYLASGGNGPRVSAVWRPRPGLPALLRHDVGAILTVLPGGTAQGDAASKLLSIETNVEPVELGDGAAYWLSGAPHTVIFTRPDGEIAVEDVRLAGNVLLWQQDGRVLRLEANVDLATALELARSVR